MNFIKFNPENRIYQNSAAPYTRNIQEYIKILIDKDIYEASTGQQFHSIEDAVDHFLLNGRYLLSDISWFVRQSDYTTMYPDILGMNALHHFIHHGVHEGREPNFFTHLAILRAINSIDKPYDSFLYYMDQELNSISTYHPLLDLNFLKDNLSPFHNSFAFAFHKARYERSLPYKFCCSDFFDISLIETYGFSDADILVAQYLSQWKSARLKPNLYFDPATYLDLNSDLVGAEPHSHFIAFGAQERRRYKVIQLTPRMLDQCVSAANIEPQIASSVRRSSNSINVVSYRSARSERIAAAVSASRRKKAIVAVPYQGGGGAEKVSNLIGSYLVERFGLNEIIFWIDERNASFPHNAPPAGVPMLYLSDIFDAQDADSDKQLAQIIVESGVDFLFIVNSQKVWRCVNKFGKGISNYTKIVPALFCFDYDSNGLIGGYAAEYGHNVMNYSWRIISDNQCFPETLNGIFNYSSEDLARFVPISMPISRDGSGLRKIHARRSRYVIWASRLDFQKNPEIVAEIARAMPSVKIDVFGSPMTGQSANYEWPANVSLKGEFSGFDSIPEIEKYGAFLYTSRFDGLPNILLEVAVAGVPIVSSIVGGIASLITSETGWPVIDHTDPNEYVRQVARCLKEFESSASKAKKLRGLVCDRHTASNFGKSMEAIIDS